MVNGKRQPIDLGFTTDSKVVPDKLWCLHVLSTLNPNHLFFAKDYMPPPRRENKRERNVLDNFDGLFDGLGEEVGKRFVKKRSKRTVTALVKSASAFKRQQVENSESLSSGLVKMNLRDRKKMERNACNEDEADKEQ